VAATRKTCPICGTTNSGKALACITCGTSLEDIPTSQAGRKESSRDSGYDFRTGETDLLERDVSRTANRFQIILGALALLAAVFIVATLVGGGQQGPNDAPEQVAAPAIPTAPPMVLATVTIGVPTTTLSPTPSATFTPSVTPTPQPCMRVVEPGDTLISIIVNCGHLSLAVMPQVLEANSIDSEAQIAVGQQIIVPWPTATTDPFAEPTEVPENDPGAQTGLSDSGLLPVVDLAFDPFAPTNTPTLLPGIMMHTVQTNENITTIAYQYGITAKTLSELNPEISFNQCDFGLTYGGPECNVFLVAGQAIRVPAPSPTPTLSPTPSGSETPTPTATPTFNLPSVVSPGDREFFRIDEIITLRWVPSGSLGPGDVYRVVVEDLTLGKLYTADTTDLIFIIPSSWQGRERPRHEYRWSVSSLNPASNGTAHVSEARHFFWQGRSEEAQT
jgi:hypothetical protein